MSLSVGDVLKIVAVLQWADGDIMQNIFNTVIGGTGGPYDGDDVVDDMVDWMDLIWANGPGNISNTVDGSEVRVYVYDSVDDDFDEVGSNAWTFLGTDGGDVLPRGVSLLVNCKTIDPDVSGKKYFGGLTEVSQTNGLWTASALAIFANYAADWVAPFTGATSGADFVPGIWSPTRTNFYPMTGTVIIPTIPAYQRRRKQGVGI